MQHKYVGDVGDFGKYGLLRALAGITTQGEPLSLGIAWYLNGSETGTPGDGKHTSYLTKPEEYRNCDPELFDCMSQIISEAGRNPEIRHLKSVERSGILGSTAVFHGEPVPLGPRKEWLSRALALTEGSRIVFMDPDNGLASRRMEKAPQLSPKHLGVREISPFVRRGQTVVIYHHLSRKDFGEQMREWAATLKSRLWLDRTPEILRYRRGTGRAFFVVPAASDADLITTRLREFRSSLWFERDHFRLLPD